MGLVTNNKNKYEFEDNIIEYFSIEEKPIENDLDIIKDKITKSKIDNEEKSKGLNLIDKYKKTINIKEKNKINEEINRFIKKNNI